MIPSPVCGVRADNLAIGEPPTKPWATQRPRSDALVVQPVMVQVAYERCLWQSPRALMLEVQPGLLHVPFPPWRTQSPRLCAGVEQPSCMQSPCAPCL